MTMRSAVSWPLPNTTIASSSRHDLDDFQPVASLQLAVAELGWCHGFPIMLDDHTAGQKLLRYEKFFERTGYVGRDFFSVSNNHF